MDTIVVLGMSGTAILLLAAVLFLLDFFTGYAVKPARETWYALAFVGILIACLLVLTAYCILTAAFLADAFSFGEVYRYSSSTLPLLYKLGGPWIGSSGSLLFMTGAFALLYALYRIRGFERVDPVREATYRIMDLFLVFFLIVSAVQDPFRQLAAVPPEGMGLNPLLQTPWVLIHPPVIFLGYVAVMFAFVLVLAGMLTRRSEDAAGGALRCSLLIAWLLLTVGIALGALWSYRVLGWGGYWAWDPVETASLLPWLGLTGYFHVSSLWKGSGPRMVVVSFFMVIFAIAVTRGGFFASVHAFGESPAAYLLLGFAVTLVLVALLAGRERAGPSPRVRGMETSLPSVSRYVAAGSLLALLGVCFLGSVTPVVQSLLTGSPVTVDPAFFTLATYPFTLAFVAALPGCQSGLGARTCGILLTASAAAGAALAVLAVPTPYLLANAAIPLLCVVGGMIVAGGIRDLLRGALPLPRGGRVLAHLGLVLILAGVVISSAGQSESPPYPVGVNATLTAPGARISVDNFHISPGQGSTWIPSHSLIGPEYATLRADLRIQENGVVHQESLRMFAYLNYGIVSEPLILNMPARDLYISMHQTNSSVASLRGALRGEVTLPVDVTLVVKSVPLISLVWMGILVMSAGMGIVLIGALRTRRRT